MNSSPNKFIAEEKKFSGFYAKDVFKTVLLAYYPFKYSVIFVLIMGVLGRLLLLANTNILGIWADSFCKDGKYCKNIPSIISGYSSIHFASIIMFTTFVGFILNTIFRIGISRIGTHAVATLYDEVTIRTSRFPLSFYDSTPVGRMITRFSSDYAAVFRMAGGPMGEFLCITFDLCLMILLTGMASPWYIPIVLISIIASFLVYKFNQTQLRKERRNVSYKRSPVLAHYSETVQGIKVIKSFGREEIFYTRFANLLNNFYGQKFKTAFFLAGFSVQMTITTSLLLLLTGITGYYLVINNLSSIGTVAAAFTFVMMSFTTVQLFFDWLSSLEEALTGVERMDDYLRKEIEGYSALPPVTVFKTNHPVYSKQNYLLTKNNPLRKLPNALLEVCNLSMRYRENLPLVLKNIDFKVEKGEHLGIIGKTGSGKSSLIQALFYLYTFEQGCVKINGQSPSAADKDTCAISLETFRSAMSLIPQDPMLFKGILRENLDPWGDTTDDYLISILHKVGLGDFLGTFSGNPLNATILEQGANLSSGQRQLLCLARCLLQNTPIVIMDEATSAVDPVSERILLSATKDLLKNKTRIVVAHRLITVAECDRIIWLENGAIKDIGKPDEVLPKFESFGK